MTRPFRFMAPMPRLVTGPRLVGGTAAWRDELRRIEDLGFSTVSISDHITRGWVMEPLVAMTAAAAATSRLRVLSLVLGNDYRHPAFVHKAIATLDVLSGGRVELGLGAGWMDSDYAATGIPFDPAPVRVDRLAESLEIIGGLFGPAPVSYAGKHYQVEELDGLPKPVQQPRPPLVVGGGGRRVLELAGRLADIVGINPRLGGGGDAVSDMSPERVAEKVGWARAAGRDPELQLSMLRVEVDGSAAASSLAAGASGDTSSPAVLVGSVAQCVERLQELRETYGISYVNLGGDVDAAAPIVAALAGT